MDSLVHSLPVPLATSNNKIRKWTKQASKGQSSEPEPLLILVQHLSLPLSLSVSLWHSGCLHHCLCTYQYTKAKGKGASFSRKPSHDSGYLDFVNFAPATHFPVVVRYLMHSKGVAKEWTTGLVNFVPTELGLTLGFGVSVSLNLKIVRNSPPLLLASCLEKLQIHSPIRNFMSSLRAALSLAGAPTLWTPHWLWHCRVQLYNRCMDILFYHYSSTIISAIRIIKLSIIKMFELAPSPPSLYPPSPEMIRLNSMQVEPRPRSWGFLIRREIENFILVDLTW